MQQVKIGEISGISLEDLDDALAGKRIFWMGEVYEEAKRLQVRRRPARACALPGLRASRPLAVVSQPWPRAVDRG